jgi:uncharacterized membrane protein YesL
LPGLFSGFFNYNKPGPGVDVDAPPKKAFFRFWELYWRKFSRFIVLNMIVFVFLLPIISLIFLLYMNWYHGILESTGALEEMLNDMQNAESGAIFLGMLPSMLIAAAISLPPQISLLLLAASVVLYGPVMCGMTYVLRNFSREEHAWISDFFARLKSNFRQGAILGIIELLAFTTLFFNITAGAAEGSAAWLDASMPVVRYVSVFLIVLILFARQYIYAMTVTFDLGIIGILKNAFAFSFLGLFRNFGVIAAELALIFVILIVPYADAILLPFFFFSFTGFLTMFACFPLIHKHMILPATRLEAGETDEETADDTPV